MFDTDFKLCRGLAIAIAIALELLLLVLLLVLVRGAWAAASSCRSDSMPLSTPVPDVRHTGCKVKTYPPLVPASVVMVFFNEPLSPLLRSITSVLDRTPPELLKEIILVDDGSDRDYTQEPLERCIPLHPLPQAPHPICPTFLEKPKQEDTTKPRTRACATRSSAASGGPALLGKLVVPRQARAQAGNHHAADGLPAVPAQLMTGVDVSSCFGLITCSPRPAAALTLGG